MENGLVSVIVETDKEKTFLIEVPSSIKHKELRELLKNEITKTSHFYFVYKNKRYESGNNKEEVIHINEGTKIYLEVTLIPEAFIAHFHENLNLDEADKKVEELTGILKLCNLKYIAKYIDLEKIKNKEIKEIMKELKEGIYLTDNPQKDIKESLSRKDGSNILTFINYLILYFPLIKK